MSSAATASARAAGSEGGGQRAGVAMRQNRPGIRQQIGSELSHPLIAVDVFFVDRQGLVDQEQVGEQGADVNRGIEIVHEL